MIGVIINTNINGGGGGGGGGGVWGRNHYKIQFGWTLRCNNPSLSISNNMKNENKLPHHLNNSKILKKTSRKRQN